MFRRAVAPARKPAFVIYTPMSDAEANRRLALAFDRATTDGSDQTMDALSDAAVHFVSRLRDGGMPPERMIVALKAALRTGHRVDWSWFPSLDVVSDWASTRMETTIYARLFGWCVEAYYDETLFASRRDRRISLAACPGSR